MPEEDLATADDDELASLGFQGLDRHYVELSGWLLSTVSAPDIYLQLSLLGLVALPCLWAIICFAWWKYREDISSVLDGERSAGEVLAISTIDICKHLL